MGYIRDQGGISLQPSQMAMHRAERVHAQLHSAKGAVCTRSFIWSSPADCMLNPALQLIRVIQLQVKLAAGQVQQASSMYANCLISLLHILMIKPVA